MRRYARHLVLPQMGEDGQEKLSRASVLIVGAGGLGAQAAGALAAMGVGGITVMDHDRVELSNLQRQTMYETADINRPKVEALRDRIEELNPECRVSALQEKLTAENARARVRGYDLVLDGTDNFAARLALHDACFQEKTTLIFAAISSFHAQFSTFKAHLGAPHPCYRCYMPQAPEVERGCAQEGIIGALAGVAGSLQALEAVKELLAIGQSLSGRIMLYDALSATARTITLTNDPHCPLCSTA